MSNTNTTVWQYHYHVQENMKESSKHFQAMIHNFLKARWSRS